MANLWTKKNPGMSVWLSGANRAAGIARGHAVAQANRQRAALARKATRLWTGTWLAGPKPKRKR